MKSFPWLFLYFAVLFPIALLSAWVAWDRLWKKSDPPADEQSECPLPSPDITRKAV